ncbi:hypothetical protein [Cellulomonas sp. Leaf334]|uniref:hypothetical protein n=1 Tax=Cellulomonas sp. Leaf334 TaxID=1736339 RepID=UPI0006FE8EE3|nr:hypothetical protein [Cellulomonas sp. Leaf334]KQR11847.1 hypothetical protein ASF78_11585 [Cellulomonas sp. Leaf334]
MSELDEVVDDLYSGAPSDFVARRDAAVKAARADKDRELATAIGELRKPTVSAWLVNLLVRDDAALAGQIVALGEGLRDAEKSLDGPALRELSKQRRQLVRSLVARARKLAQPTGQKIGDAVVQELDATLTAALADPAVAREVVSGRLTAAREYAGFGSADASDSPAPAPTPPPSKEKPPQATPARGKLRLVGESERAEPPGESAAERDRRRRREEREQRARDEAQAAWEQAERAATDAKRRHDAAVAARDESAAEVERAEGAAARAHEEEDDLVRALAEARRRLAAAGKAAAVADKEVGTAQQTLRADERELTTAERELHRAERTLESAATAREATSPSS